MSTSFEYDHAYLREAVGGPLTEAMAQLAVLQPEDPIEFIGNFLLRYVENEHQKQAMTKGDYQKDISSSYGLKVEVDLTDIELQEVLMQERKLQTQIQHATSPTELYHIFAECLVSCLHAEEAYIGLKTIDPITHVNLVHWIASSKSGPLGLATGTVSNIVDKWITEDKGITFDVFKEVEDATGAVDTDGNPLPPAIPKYIHIENVLREPRMKFYHVPKLGAYLTRGLEYKSFLHSDIYNEINPEEPHTKQEWLVIGVDTMGQARPFTSIEIESFQRSTSLFITTLETLERTLYLHEMEQKKKEDVQLKEYYIVFLSQVTTHEENLILQLQSLGEEEKEIKEAELRVSFLTSILIDGISSLSLPFSRIIPYKLHVLNVFALVLEIFGYASISIYNSATKVPSWEKMTILLKESMLETKLKEFQPSVPLSSSLCAKVKQQLGEISKQELEQMCPIASIFYTWISALVLYSERYEIAMTKTLEKNEILEETM